MGSCLILLQTFNLTPGENKIPSEFLYEPQDANDTTAQVRLPPGLD